MSTLGFGDITFHSDLGRLFSLIVLLSGVVLLLIMLPFAFIRYFYAPLARGSDPAAGAEGSVQGPLRPRHHQPPRLDHPGPDPEAGLQPHPPTSSSSPTPVVAERMGGDGISVVSGRDRQPDDLGVPPVARGAHGLRQCRRHDQHRHHADRPRARRRGADLRPGPKTKTRSTSSSCPAPPRCCRSSASSASTWPRASPPAPIRRTSWGTFEDLEIAEFIVHGTSLVGQTLRETRLRELTGVNVVSVLGAGAAVLRPSEATGSPNSRCRWRSAPTSRWTSSTSCSARVTTRPTRC